MDDDVVLKGGTPDESDEFSETDLIDEDELDLDLPEGEGESW